MDFSLLFILSISPFALCIFFFKLKLEIDSIKGDASLEGFAVDLIRELSLILGFNYTFIVEEDAEYGKHVADGVWDGMIGRLMKGVICCA